MGAEWSKSADLSFISVEEGNVPEDWLLLPMVALCSLRAPLCFRFLRRPASKKEDDWATM
jgi:hypothetical protein